jgi:hypothetical protein
MRVRESSPYRLDGSGDGPSLALDLVAAKRERDREAQDRLARFARWSQTVSSNLGFAVVDTDSASQIVPDGYRQIAALTAGADRPLASAAERGRLTDATPFTIPAVAAADGMGDHDEGERPAEGTLGTAGATVTPRGVAGRLPITRDLLEAASPAGDLIVLQALREAYDLAVERRIYAHITDLTAGTITAGRVPSGAQATTSSGAALADDLRAALARYATVRRRRPRSVVVGGPQAELLAGDLDESTGDDAAMWRTQGATVNPAVIPFDADPAAIILGRGDLYVLESPLIEFRFGEKHGPETFELAAWAYVAVTTVRPVGVSVIRHSA